MRFFSKNNSLESKNDRQLWVNVLSKIANPVLTNMASGTLKKNMPVEYVKKDRAKFAHLEAVGRLIWVFLLGWNWGQIIVMKVS